MTWSHPSYEAVARLVNRRTGLNFLPNRQDTAELGMHRAMARTGIRDPALYPALLETHAGALDDLLSELTVGETYFFREPAQFEFIRREVLPDIRHRSPEHVIRVWSAGCASGEEAYSLAILFEQAGLADRASIHATDLSRTALAQAQRGVYGTWSLRHEGAARVQPYLARDPAGAKAERYALDEHVRRRVTFAYLNLALDAYPSFATGIWAMDLIVCRNVLIYLDRETVQRVALRLFESLAPGGWLLTASADPPLTDAAPFETVVTDAGVFYRRLAESGRRKAEGGRQEAEVRSQGDATAEPAFAGGTDIPVRAEKPADGLWTADHPLAEVRIAQEPDDDVRVTTGTGEVVADATAAARQVRELAHVDVAAAERACAGAVQCFPLATELHYLHAVLLMDLGRDAEAIQGLRRVIYLDRSLVIAHFTLGALLWRRGDRAGARRAYRNARDLGAARPAEEIVPFSDGEQARRLTEAAAFQVALLEAAPEATP